MKKEFFIIKSLTINEQWKIIYEIPFVHQLNPILLLMMERRINSMDHLKLITAKLQDLNDSCKELKIEGDYASGFVDHEFVGKELDFCFFLQSNKILRCSDIVYIYAQYRNTYFQATKGQISYKKNGTSKAFDSEHLEKMHLFFQVNQPVTFIRALFKRSEVYRELPSVLAVAIFLAVNKNNCYSFFLHFLLFNIKYHSIVSVLNMFGPYYAMKRRSELLMDFTDYCQKNLKVSLKGVIYLSNFHFEGAKSSL